MRSGQLDLSTGGRLFVAQKGSADELVVFLHAVGSDHTSWYHQIERLHDRYTVVACDLRGHGRSPIEDDLALIRDIVNIGTFAKDTIALIEHLDYRRAHLVGNSIGGIVALEVFKRRSDMVQSLTLANTWAYHPEWDRRIQSMQERLASMTLAQSAEESTPALFAPTASRELIEHAVRIESAKNPSVYLASWVSMFQTDYRRMLELIDVPLLLIGGTLDQVTPTDPLLTSIAAAVPGAELINIEGAGHYANLDHPAEVTRALKSHLLRARGSESQRMSIVEPQPVTVDSTITAQALLAVLARRGVRCLFAHSDALPQSDSEGRLQTVAAADAGSAMAMAHGHWALSGRPQAVVVGAAEAGSAIHAARSHVPMLILAASAPWFESGHDGCRTAPVQWGQPPIERHGSMKWDHELKSARGLDAIVDRALAIAASDPGGPVSITLPPEVLCERLEGYTFDSAPRQLPAASAESSTDAVEKAARLISKAQRPLIVTGELGRYRGGPEALVQLAQRHGIAVVEFGKRNFFNFPTRHPQHLGFNPSPFVKNADVIIVIESHVPWIPAFANVSHKPRVIQIGIDPLGAQLPLRTFPSDITLAGNPALTLRRLTSCLDKSRPDRERIATRAQSYASEHRRVIQAAQSRAIADAAKPRISTQFLSYCLGEAIDDRVVIFNEHDLDPQLIPRRLTDSWFESSIAGGRGWAVAAALGAQFANPELTMLAAVGEGGYELHPARLPIVVVAHGDEHVQLEKVAEACGGRGLHVESPRELPATLRRALAIAREEKTHALVHVV